MSITSFGLGLHLLQICMYTSSTLLSSPFIELKSSTSTSIFTFTRMTTWDVISHSTFFHTWIACLSSSCEDHLLFISFQTLIMFHMSPTYMTCGVSLWLLLFLLIGSWCCSTWTWCWWSLASASFPCWCLVLRIRKWIKWPKQTHWSE